MPADIFALGIFQKGFLIDAKAVLDHHPFIYASCIAEMTGAYHNTQLLLRYGLAIFFAWDYVSQIEVARITVVSY
jgi:hypothetical protein